MRNLIEAVSLVVFFVVLNLTMYRHFYNKGKDSVVTEVEPLHNFVCPYCENIVHGLTELDRALHVSCIAKSQADFDAEAKKRAAIPKQSADDEYFVEKKKYQAWSTAGKRGYPNDYIWEYKGSSGYYETYISIIYRNGENVKTVSAESAPVRDSLVEQAIELDKHKQKAARKKVKG